LKARGAACFAWQELYQLQLSHSLDFGALFQSFAGAFLRTGIWIYSGENQGEIGCLHFTICFKTEFHYPRIAAPLQALVVQCETVNVPKEDLHAVSATTEEYEDMTIEGIHAEICCDKAAESIKGKTHID